MTIRPPREMAWGATSALPVSFVMALKCYRAPLQQTAGRLRDGPEVLPGATSALPVGFTTALKCYRAPLQPHDHDHDHIYIMIRKIMIIMIMIMKGLLAKRRRPLPASLVTDVTVAA